MPRPAFPRSIVEFQRWFPDEEACLDYLAACRWPDGFACPRCGHREAVVLSRRALWQCPACRHQTSVTAGTILHRTHLPLQQWFWAAYLVSTATPGISAVQLQRQLGLTRYETAWTLLHKLRRAMVDPERQPLTGVVEVDECFVGGPEAGLRGDRQRGDKQLVVVAVERRGAGSGRARLRVVPDASADSLCGFVAGGVEPGAAVHTDRWQGYRRLARLGFDHHRHGPAAAVDLDEVLPRVHRVISHLKTWLAGTHRGVSGEHLQVYLDEFAFRFNRRRVPMAAFQTLLGLGTQQPPTTRAELVARTGGV